RPAWEPGGPDPEVLGLDPMAPTAPLPVPARPQRRMETITAPVTEASVLRRNVVRTALAVEPRDGRLWIFVPPVDTTEDYVELIMAIAATAAAIAMSTLSER